MVYGTVLYVHPVSELIYLMLAVTPTPDTFKSYFECKIYSTIYSTTTYDETIGSELPVDLCTPLNFQCFYKDCAFYQILGKFAFISKKDIEEPSKPPEPPKNKLKKDKKNQKRTKLNPLIKKKSHSETLPGSFDILAERFGMQAGPSEPGMSTRQPVNSAMKLPPVFRKLFVLRLHFMDNVIEMTQHESKIKKNFMSPAEVEICGVYEVAVQKHVQERMIVKMSSEFHAAVRDIHISDSIPQREIGMTLRNIQYPVGSKIRCRVVSTDIDRQNVFLTCKSELVNLSKKYLPMSYDEIEVGQYMRGVITKVRRECIHILFMNNIKARAYPPHIPEDETFHRSKTVVCKVISCLPNKFMLKVALIEEDADMMSLSSQSSDDIPKLQWRRRLYEQLSESPIKNIPLPVKRTAEQVEDKRPIKTILSSKKRRTAVRLEDELMEEERIQAVKRWREESSDSSPSAITLSQVFYPDSMRQNISSAAAPAQDITVRGLITDMTDSYITVRFAKSLHAASISPPTHMNSCYDSACKTCEEEKAAIFRNFTLHSLVDISLVEKSEITHVPGVAKS